MAIQAAAGEDRGDTAVEIGLGGHNGHGKPPAQEAPGENRDGGSESRHRFTIRTACRRRYQVASAAAAAVNPTYLPRKPRAFPIAIASGFGIVPPPAARACCRAKRNILGACRKGGNCLAGRDRSQTPTAPRVLPGGHTAAPNSVCSKRGQPRRTTKRGSPTMPD